MNKKERASAINAGLKKFYGTPKTALNFTNPLQLLIATILSAQCTDKVVNQVCEPLFKKYKTAEQWAAIPQENLENLIRKTGFYHNKAKSIHKLAIALIEKYNGKVPGTMEELVKLPGAGRKTANVVLGEIFNTPGIIVDTHFKRLSNRMGLTKQTDPVKIEFEIQKLLPEKEWTAFSHRIVTHGRQICIARKPKCDECPVASICPKVGV